MSDSPNIERLNIKLGDIIEIEAPLNSILNNKIFLIQYIDRERLVLVNGDTPSIALLLKANGELYDESITAINILDSDINLGYARQNRLMVGSWIDIYFGGDIPLVVTGEISNLENDMIEIKTYPENEVIYIDFAYKGLPETLLIEKINLRSSPLSQKRNKGQAEAEAESESNLEKDVDDGQQFESYEDREEFNLVDFENVENVENVENSQNIAKNKELLIEADQIIIGRKLEDIIQVVDVPEYQQRFGIDKQTNDMLDEFLSKIPTSRRNQGNMNSIHKLIERYKELRQEFSQFDNNNNAISKKIRGDSHKPLLETLKAFDKKLYWILPVVKNSKNLYDVTNDEDLLYITTSTLADSILAESELTSNWKSNLSNEEENRYNNYIKELNTLSTPFTNYGIEDYIISKEVATNLDTIVDTLNDQYSYTADRDDKIVTRRFVMQQYNTGLTRLESIITENRKIINKNMKITKNDVLLLKSIITLPYPVYRFSHINLPGTSIMDKSDLNHHFINYWELFKKSTFVNRYIIDDLAIEVKYNPDTFLNNIKEFLLDESIERDPNITIQESRYNKYLDCFIPDTETIFDLLDVKDRVDDRYNLTFDKITKSLEPFMIYNNDITSKSYKTIIHFLNNKTRGYKKDFIANNKNFQAKINQKIGQGEKPAARAFSLFNIFSANRDIQVSVFKSYNITDQDKTLYSSEELLNKMVRIDYARLFYSAVSKVSVDLMVSGVLDKFIDIEKNLNKKQGLGDRDRDKDKDKDNDCKQYILSKKYFALDELEYDNNKKIYFDKKYDQTFYDFINQYKKERDTLSSEEFKTFMIAILVEANGFTQDNAIRQINAMLENKKEVVNGDYALLEIDEKTNEIYKREGNVWIKDTTISDNVFFDLNPNKFFCESKLTCFYNTNKNNDKQQDDFGKCENSADIEKTLQKKNLKDIMGQFDEEYRVDLQKIKNKINDAYNYNLAIIGRIIGLERDKKLTYNNEYLKISSDIDQNDIKFSPFEKLRDLILGQTDFLKKNADIIKFSLKFARKPYDRENQYWFYCVKTDIELLPSFIVRLAGVASNSQEYQRELDYICAEQGTISDDGDRWVDKYSGYIIKYIDYNVEEGFNEEGYKLQTRSVLDQDLGAILLAKDKKSVKRDKIKEKKVNEKEVDENRLDKKNKQVYLDLNAKTVLNVIIALTDNMAINADAINAEGMYDYIIKNVLDIQKKSVSSPEDYAKLVEKAQRQGKKNIPSFEEAFNSSLLILTLVYLLVAIQTSIPEIKTPKTFPGCIKSFSGYPMEGSIDKSGLIYIACVAYKLKSSIKPWNTIMKTKEATIVQKMELIIEKFIQPNAEIKRLFQVKKEFLLLQDNAVIPEKLDVKNWLTFLPPLVPLNIKDLHGISKIFQDELRANIKKGSLKQIDNILVLETKQILFALYIQQSIQTVVKQQHPLLTTMTGNPFLENACCNGEKNTVSYFEGKDKSIKMYNDIVVEYSNILYDINRMSTAPLLMHPYNTRIVYPGLSEIFTEETIYKAFIYYCKFNKVLYPISEELRSICLEKPVDFNPDDTITGKITRLKADGKNYNNLVFDQLIMYLSKNNIIPMDLFRPVENNIDNINNINNLMAITVALDERDSQVIPAQFRTKFADLLDSYGIIGNNEPVREMKNYLSRQNELTDTIICDFIQKNSKLTKSKMKNFIECLTTINQFSSDAPEKMIVFMRQNIINLVAILPNIILNEIDYANIVIPKHWGLSAIHQIDVANIIRDNYSGLSSMYRDPQLQMVLTRIQGICNDIVLLSNNTFYRHDLIDTSVSKDEKDENPVYSSIFSDRMVGLLSKYYFNCVLIEYINLVNSQDILRIDIIENIALIEENRLGEGDINEFELISGEKKELSLKVATLLIEFMNIICTSKNVVDFTYESVMNKVLRSKNKEKTIITDYLKDLTEEEREIENIFKANRLERWSKGLQKGLTQYVGDNYDEEREQIDRQAQMERKLGVKDFVTDMNRDIYKLDMQDEEMRDEEIEREEYDIGDFLGDGDYRDDDLDDD